MPEMFIIFNAAHNQYTLKFPSGLSIGWSLPKELPPTPFGIDWAKLGTGKDLVLLCDVTFTRGRHSITARAGWHYDGASIPWFIRWAPGYERIGAHLWAATFHDWIIEHPEEGLSRVLADAWFITLLLDTGVDEGQSKWMYRAVRVHSLRCAWRAGEEGPIISAAASEAAKAPETKAAAFKTVMLESSLSQNDPPA